MSTSAAKTLSLVITGVTADFIVEKCQVRDAISELYQCDLWFCSETAVNAEDVIGKQAKLTITVQAMTTVYQGLLFCFEHVGRAKTSGKHISATGNHLYKATISPELRLLELDSQNAVYGSDNAVSVVDLIEHILKPKKIEYSIASLCNTYPKTDFVVQYNESDLNFIKRQCEHHGVSFFHQMSNGKEVCVFADKTSGYGTMDRGPIQSELSVFTGKSNDAINYNPGAALNSTKDPTFANFGYRALAMPKTVRMRDYNAPEPESKLTKSVDIAALGTTPPAQTSTGPTPTAAELRKNGISRARVEYGSVIRQDTAKPTDTVDRFARLRAEAIKARQKIFFGTSNCPSLRAGQRFRLIGDTVHAGYYLVTSVIQEVCLPLEGTKGHGGLQGQTFQARVECIPASVTFRPELNTPKPQVAGVFTAFIDADSKNIPDNEPAVDEHGRYRLSFDFDEHTKKPGQGSGRVPKAQPYAGPGDTGMHFPLRKGTEVIVACLNGDIDRPIIVGAVPNHAMPDVVRRTAAIGNHITPHRMHRIRTGSGAAFELNDHADANGIVSGPQVALLAADSHLRIGHYAPLRDGSTYWLRTYKSTVESTNNPAPAINALSVATNIDAAQEANRKTYSDKDACANWREALVLASDVKDQSGYTWYGQGYLLKPGYKIHPTLVQHFIRPQYQIVKASNVYGESAYIMPTIISDGEKYYSNRVGQRELLKLNVKQEPDYEFQRNKGGTLLQTNQLILEVSGGSTAFFGKGYTQYVNKGDFDVEVPAGLASINAANGITLEAGTADKPANISLIAYGYVKQEAKGPVSDHFYSTQERRIYGYSKEWFYGSKRSEHHGTRESLFYGNNASVAMGGSQSVFIGLRISLSVSADLSLRLSTNISANIGDSLNVRIGNNIAINLSSKITLATGGVLNFCATVKMDFIVAEMKQVFSSQKIVTTDFKSAVMDAKKVVLSLASVEVDLKSNSLKAEQTNTIETKVGSAGFAMINQLFV